MPFVNDQPLPEFSRYTFGTMSLGRIEDRLDDDVATARAAMDADVWFHTSQEYAGGRCFQVLRHAFDEDRAAVPPLIFKIRCNSARHLRFDVDDALRRLDVDRVDVAQLCKSNHEKREIVDDFLEEGPMYQACRELLEAGKVGHFVFEIFASFSGDALRAVEHGMFPGVIFYYNPVERQVSDALFDRLEQARTPILALRTMGGGVVDADRATRKQQKDPDASDVALRQALQPLYERSGAPSWLDFSMRFLLSQPTVKTTIGGTSSRPHLREYLDAAERFEPLPADLVEQIKQVQRQHPA